MARTSSRVRDLAHSGGNGVHAGHGCQWLLRTALAKAASAHTSGRTDGRNRCSKRRLCLPLDPFPFDQNGPAPPEVDVGGCQVCRCSRDSTTPDAFTFTIRYPVEEALRAKARGGIAEIAHGI